MFRDIGLFREHLGPNNIFIYNYIHDVSYYLLSININNYNFFKY